MLTFTCIFPGSPVVSILDAMFTASPQISYNGFWAPTTPAVTSPWEIPILNLKRKVVFCFLYYSWSNIRPFKLFTTFSNFISNTHVSSKLLIILPTDFYLESTYLWGFDVVNDLAFILSSTDIICTANCAITLTTLSLQFSSLSVLCIEPRRCASNPQAAMYVVPKWKQYQTNSNYYFRFQFVSVLIYPS